MSKIRHRGTTLLSTLATVSLMAVLGLVLSQISIQHLTFSTIKVARQSALDLARSASSLAIAQLSQDPDFGTRPNTPMLQVPGTDPHDRGVVLFDSSQADAKGLPYSLNNFKGQAAKTGSLRNVVPPSTVHIVAVGTAAGQKRRVEVYLALPPFPFALASSGPIRAARGVQIAGLTGVPSVGNILVPNPSSLVEADLVSNDPSADAVFLGPGTDIRGSVQAVGKIALDPSAPQGSIQVRGSLHQNSQAEQLPEQQILQYDPLKSGDDYTAIQTPHLVGGSNRLGGRLRRQGSLEVRDGLYLDGCLLFIDGDLKVSGGLKGKGVVVATGSILLEGQSQFESGQGVALLSGQNTAISGSGALGSYFQGLIYTKGRFSADRVTLVGSLIADNQQRPSPVLLTDTRILSNPNPTVRVTLPRPNSGPPAADPRLGPVLGSFSVTVFDRETGSKGTVAVEIRQGPSGLWVQVGGAPAELVEDPALVLDHIVQSLGAFSFGPLRPQLDPIISRFDPIWQPPESQAPEPDPAVITVDPSSFLKLQERIRVVSYREDR